MNEEFEKWFEEQLDIGEFLIADKPVALRAWQASRKQALSEAANKCDEWATQLTAYDSAKCATAETCAEIIREMQKE